MITMNAAIETGCGGTIEKTEAVVSDIFLTSKEAGGTPECFSEEHLIHEHLDTITEDENLTLDFPVTIDINELDLNGEGGSFFDSVAIDAAGKTLVGNSIDRNKKLCSSRNSKLTLEEEERVAEILCQEDDALENYIVPTEEELTRHTELDSLLDALGYVFDDEHITQDKTAGRGDPILRQLAEERSLAEKERLIDEALRCLLREPLPRVIRYQHNAATDDVVSLLSSGDSVLSMPISEDAIKDLVKQVKQALEEDCLALADHASVRLLATAILNDEAVKGSAGSNR